MEKKNDTKRTFRKTTVEMTGEAEVLVVNTRFMMRAFEAALACSTLYYYFAKTVRQKNRLKKMCQLYHVSSANFLQNLEME